MSDAAEVRALIAKADAVLAARDGRGNDMLIRQMRDALEAAHAEPDDDEREALAVAVGRVLFDVSNFPEKAQSRLLGQSMTPLRQKLVESVENAGFRRSTRVPVSRDELASRMKWLADPEEAAVLARAFHRDYDIYPKPDRNAADPAPARCICDGWSFGQPTHPFIVNVQCPVHGMLADSGEAGR